MNRAEILREVERCVCTDRQDDYGTPENSFGAIATLWNVYLQDRLKTDIIAEDVAMMMALLKIARIQTGRYKADSYIDACGYLAIAGELGHEAAQDMIANKYKTEQD